MEQEEKYYEYNFDAYIEFEFIKLINDLFNVKLF